MRRDPGVGAEAVPLHMLRGRSIRETGRSAATACGVVVEGKEPELVVDLPVRNCLAQGDWLLRGA